MISLPGDPYYSRPSRSSSSESFSSISQVGDYRSDTSDPENFLSAHINFNIDHPDTAHNSRHQIHPSSHLRYTHSAKDLHRITGLPNGQRRAPFATIPRSYSSNSSLASNESKDKRNQPIPPKGNIMYHPSRYKTELCRQWEELGYCEYSERCLFAHGSYELKPLPNRHPKYKTEKCSAFHEQGFCSFGPRCSFIHSKPDPNQILQQVIGKLPKIPMPENPEDKENIIVVDEDDDASDGGIMMDGDRLPVFKKICSNPDLLSK